MQFDPDKNEFIGDVYAGPPLPYIWTDEEKQEFITVLEDIIAHNLEEIRKKQRIVTNLESKVHEAREKVSIPSESNV